jgi:hypothetical protein
MGFRHFVLYSLLFGVFSPVCGQDKTDSFLVALLRSHGSPALLRVLDNPDSFRYQLIYTRIDRDKENGPHFQNLYYRVDGENAAGVFGIGENG